MARAPKKEKAIVEKVAKEAAPRKQRAKATEAVTADMTEQVTEVVGATATEAGDGFSVTTADTSGTDTPAVTTTRSKINRAKYDYVVHDDIKTPSGRASVDNNDAVAAALRGMTVEQVMDTLTKSGGTVQTKWVNLNQGMQRMAAGNVIRRIYNAGEPVLLPDGTKLQGTAKPKPEPKPKAEPKPRAPRTPRKAKAEATPAPSEAAGEPGEADPGEPDFVQSDE